MNISNKKIESLYLPRTNFCVNFIIGQHNIFNYCTNNTKIQCKNCIMNFNNIKILIKKYRNEFK